MISELLCRLFGHRWNERPELVPEDRDTFECTRCGVWGYRPARVGEWEVPSEIYD